MIMLTIFGFCIDEPSTFDYDNDGLALNSLDSQHLYFHALYPTGRVHARVLSMSRSTYVHDFYNSVV